jgi:predicted dehydrogenase
MATLGWGVLGCGDITDKRGAPAILAQEDSRLVAFCSRERARAEEFAARHRDPRAAATRAYDSLEEMLADKAVTAVYVATEHNRHCAETIHAAEAGRHVLCEKPMAMNGEECRRMIAACAANGVALAVAYYRRWYPKVRKMKELLEAGAIGEVVSGNIFLGSRLNAARVGPENWRLQAERSGGGALVDTGSHRLDILCYLLGEPARVAGFAERQEMPIEAPDAESLLIRMRSGAHIVSRHSFRTRAGRDDFELFGTRGSLVASPMDGDRLTVTVEGQPETFELPKHANVHFPLFDSFARRVSRGEPPEFDGTDGLQASRIIQGCYDSARTGRVVDV